MLIQSEKIQKGIQALTMRAPTMDDVTGIVNLLNICAIDQIGNPDSSRNQLISEWTEPHFEPSHSVRVVETADGEIVGYVEVWDTEPLPVSNWVWGRVHPDFEGLGIGTGLMSWAEKRLKETLDRVPKDLQVAFRSGSLSTHRPTIELMENLGMRLVRRFWRMVIDLEDPVPKPLVPDGLEIKSLVDVNDLPAINRAFNDAFRDHWGFVEQPEEESLAKWEHWIATDDEFRPSLWFIAMDGEEIAGICLCRQREYEDPDMGWVNILGVRRPWRNQGLALAMLHYAFNVFRDMGKFRAGLGVDANSLTGATRLYEKAGMHVAREFYTYEKVLRAGRDISTKTVKV